MKKLTCLIFFLLIFFTSPVSALAASFSLSPATKNTSVNSTFTVDLIIDTAGVKTTGTDVILTYTPSILEVVDVTFPSPPPYTTNTKTIDNTNGELNINCSVQSAAYAYSGTTTLATITLKGISTGTSSLRFLCDPGSTTDSNIINLNGQDVLVCESLTSGSYTFTSAGGDADTTPTATPTQSYGTGDETDDDTELPDSGTTEVTLAIAVISILFILTGAKLLFAKRTS